MNTQVNIRKAKSSDLPQVQALFAEDGMGKPTLACCLQGYAAYNERGELVGFIRILKVQDTQNPQGDGCYVYPVIVYKSWQGYGVGSALINYAHKKFGELKLVACKASQDFYPKCGFEPLAWEEVAPRIAQDCDHCADLDSCKPKAYILR